MKTIGLLGGMSWESTAEYYRLINQGINAELGGLHSAKIILNSIDFDEIEKLQHANEWDRLEEILSLEAQALERAGAQGLMICTNTMHKLADKILENINIPIIHIADATAKDLVLNNIKKVALLGTAFTMEEEFYKSRLTQKYGLEVIIPSERGREDIHSIIYDELCLGITKDSSRDRYVQIIKELADDGAEAVILGCTEIGLLISPKDSPIPTYDTTVIHANSAVKWMLS